MRSKVRRFGAAMAAALWGDTPLTHASRPRATLHAGTGSRLVRAAAVAAVILLVLRPARATAGCSCEAGYVLPHVAYHAGAFGGHCTLQPMTMLRARGLALLLEEHVASKIARGELPAKRLHVRGKGSWENQAIPLQVSQNRQGFYIQGAHLLDLRNLIRTIDDFGSPDWASFCPDMGSVAARAPALTPQELDASVVARFDEILDARVGEPDLGDLRARAIRVHEVGELAIVYQDDSLFYELAGTRLDIQPYGFLPVQVGRRYVLRDGESIVAMEEGAIVASHRLVKPPQNRGDCWHAAVAVAHAEWVNVHCYQSSFIALTYSLARNRFFDVEVQGVWSDAPRWRRPDGLFVGECG